MFAPSFLSTLCLALAVAATPIAPVITVRNGPSVSLPIKRQVNDKAIRNLYQHDVNRAKRIISRVSGKVSNHPFQIPM